MPVADQMDAIADLAERYSFDEVRVTHEQNLVLPHVRLADLWEVYRALKAIGLAEANAGLVTDIIACPGLDYCALANARSIPIAQRISERLAARQDAIGDLKIKISGCINACGHHHVGHIGILGVEKRGEEHYQLLLGGSGAEDAALAAITGPGFGPDGIVDAVEKVVDTYLELRSSADGALPRRLRPPRPRPLQGGALCRLTPLPARRVPLPAYGEGSGVRGIPTSDVRKSRPSLSLPHERGVGSARPGPAAIWRDGAFRRDAWVTAEAEPRCPTRPVILSKKRWLAEREQLARRNAPLGLLIEAGETIDDIAADLPRFALIALELPQVLRRPRLLHRPAAAREAWLHGRAARRRQRAVRPDPLHAPRRLRRLRGHARPHPPRARRGPHPRGHPPLPARRPRRAAPPAPVPGCAAAAARGRGEIAAWNDAGATGRQCFVSMTPEQDRRAKARLGARLPTRCHFQGRRRCHASA